MATSAHDNLVALGAKWLKKQGFAVIATEINAVGSREQADVVAFRSTCSTIIEVKVSRADFLADTKKPERQIGATGLGVYRFYLCPKDMIKPNDLPLKWGLLYEDGGKITEVVRPRGNIWPSYGRDEWKEWQHAPNRDAERAALFSIARRLSRSEPILK
ncbi:MAG: hypothetical protein V4713_03620 [Pseudomonadota bacterium]